MKLTRSELNRLEVWLLSGLDVYYRASYLEQNVAVRKRFLEKGV